MYLVHRSYYSYEADRLIRRPQVLGMFNMSTEQNQVAASVSAAPACPTAEASAACCISSCNFKFKSCQKQTQTTCHQETRYNSPLDSTRCPQDRTSWDRTFPRVLAMTPACPQVCLLDPDICVFCMLHLVCALKCQWKSPDALVAMDLLLKSP